MALTARELDGVIRSGNGWDGRDLGVCKWQGIGVTAGRFVRSDLGERWRIFSPAKRGQFGVEMGLGGRALRRCWDVGFWPRGGRENAGRFRGIIRVWCY